MAEDKNIITPKETKVSSDAKALADKPTGQAPPNDPPKGEAGEVVEKPVIEVAPKKVEASTGQAPVVEVLPIKTTKSSDTPPTVETEKPPAPTPTPPPAKQTPTPPPTPKPATPKPHPRPTSPASELAGGRVNPLLSKERKSVPAPTPPPAKQTQPMGGQAKVVGIPESHPAIPFMTQFLDKLKELRGRANTARHEKVEENLNKILEYAREHNRIDNKDARELTGLSDERARYYLDKLEKEKKLVQFGQKGPGVFYKPTK